jgi:hypothetical protein
MRDGVLKLEKIETGDEGLIEVFRAKAPGG